MLVLVEHDLQDSKPALQKPRVRGENKPVSQNFK